MSGESAGGFSLGNGGAEIPPLAIAQKLLEIASQPVFNTALGLLSTGFEGGSQGLDKFGFHAMIPFRYNLLFRQRA
jgi:hypothetical protein